MQFEDSVLRSDNRAQVCVFACAVHFSVSCVEQLLFDFSLAVWRVWSGGCLAAALVEPSRGSAGSQPRGHYTHACENAVLLKERTMLLLS